MAAPKGKKIKKRKNKGNIKGLYISTRKIKKLGRYKNTRNKCKIIKKAKKDAKMLTNKDYIGIFKYVSQYNLSISGD